jgi:hypothetical protein
VIRYDDMKSFADQALSASGAAHDDAAQSEDEIELDSDFPEEPRPALQ